MNITIIVHTEKKQKLEKLLDVLLTHSNKDNFSIYIHAKGYVPWEDENIKNNIVKFKNFYAYPTGKSVVESTIEIITKVKNENLLIIDENNYSSNLIEWDESNFDSLLCQRNELFSLKLDTKYKDLKWFILDLISQKKKKFIEFSDNSSDNERYLKKFESPLFFEKIVYIDGGMGDHIMALPLLNKIQKEVYVSCKYPNLFSHLDLKGFIDWNDTLFGGYLRFVYDYGSNNNSKTIVDAFFEIYGYEREKSDVLKFTGPRLPIQDSLLDKKVALICTSAAKINNLDSNKDWKDLRWFKLVNELQKMGYLVIQVGTKKDNQIPNANFKFLDGSLNDLASFVDKCELWISVDTFFHHFAASIKPEVGICLTPFYNDHAKHPGVRYIEKDCGKNFSDRRWWLDLQQPERKECMELIQVSDVLDSVKKKIKVKILCGNPNFDNCANWRGHMQYKNIDGIDFTISDTFNFDIEEDSKYDVFMIIRPLKGFLEYIKLLKNKGVKVVVDYDDCLPLMFNSQEITEHINEVIKILKESDLIITTNEKLKTYFYFHSYNENIEVIPNIIDEDLISADKKDNEDKIILGWFGNSGHLNNLKIINKIVLRILDEFDNVYLNVYSDSEEIFNLFEHEKTKNIPYKFNFKEFQKDLGDIDINLAPLEEDYFNLHKSNIRIILPGYKGIPSIASNFGEYKSLGNKNVILCDDEDEWYVGLKNLIENTEYRKGLSKNIKEYVEHNLTLEKYKNMKSNVFQKLIKNY